MRSSLSSLKNSDRLVPSASTISLRVAMDGEVRLRSVWEEKALGQLASAGQLFQGQPLLDAELLDFMADIQIDASLSVCSNIKPQSYFY